MKMGVKESSQGDWCFSGRNLRDTLVVVRERKTQTTIHIKLVKHRSSAEIDNPNNSDNGEG